MRRFEIQPYLKIAVSDGVKPDRVGPRAGVIARRDVPLLPNCGDGEALDLAPRRLVPILPLDARVGGAPLPAVGVRKPETLAPAMESEIVVSSRAFLVDAKRYHQSSNKWLTPG